MSGMDWHVLWSYRGDLADGLWLTVWISAVAIVGATVIGTICGFLLASRTFYLRRLTETWVAALRNVPVVVKLFFLHFVIGLPALWAAIIGLIVHQSSYIADVTAAGLRSIPRGQEEAGASTGLTKVQTARYVLLPQALRYSLPALTTQFASIVKNSSVVMLLAIEDLTFMTKKIESETFRGLEAATAVTVIYIAIVAVVIIAMSRVQYAVEKQFR